MANGNTDVIREMREIIREGRSVDIDTRDRLLFTAVIDIYEKLESFRPMWTFYKIFMWAMSAIMLALIAKVFR